MPPEQVTPIPQPVRPANEHKQQRKALLFGTGGIAVFIIGLFLGFAALLGAILGAYSFRISMGLKYAPGMALGLIAVVLNVGMFILASFVR